MTKTDSIFEGNKMALNREAAQQWLNFCEAVERLMDNQDFQQLMDVYTRHEVVRLSGLLTDQSVLMSNSRDILLKDIVDDMKAASCFRKYIYDGVPRIKQYAIKALEDLNK